MIHRFRTRLLAAALFLLACGPLAANAVSWPQEIEAEQATIVIYQPQPERLNGNVLNARAAISIEPAGGGDALFGAMFFTARIDTDRDAGTVTVRDVTVDSVKWPDSSDAHEQQFTALVEGAIPANGFEISLERLNASLANAEVVQQSLDQIKNDPPDIVFSEELAVLLLFDGEPRFSKIEDSPYEKADNTPFAVARHARSKTCYLTAGAFWYTAKDPLGPWSTTTPPDDLAKMVPKPEDPDSLPTKPSKIIAVTEPTEVISTDGTPDWVSLAGGKLLYVSNTETPWVRELSTGNMYVLLSGRWYRAKSAAGPWTFVRGDELPESFSEIPPASDIGGLRASVAGTEEANDAVLDAAIPQTAAIKRDEASLTVEYDGKPEFKRIDGTGVSYAVNTAAQVLLIDGTYYAVDNGVWFAAQSATGPWAVADDIPEDQIQQIPPSEPVYNVTHVHVYDSTPEVVYVGYTPGYMWSFPYYGVPIYGTGWRYPSYWGPYYYPRPPTWGFHVGWNPWTGWNFGVSWSNGFFSVGVGWSSYHRNYCCGGGWYGGGYRRPVVINTGDINLGNNINIGNRVDINNRIGDNNLNIDRDNSRNLYNRPENRARVADRSTVQRDRKMARPATDRANNVYADRNGEVARRDGNDWQVRDKGSWQPSTSTRDVSRPSTSPSTRDVSRPTASTRPSTRSIDRSSLDRSHAARSRGVSREMSRPSSRGGGARRRR
jgi:hypothetical protein